MSETEGLVVDDVSVSFGGLNAVRDVSLVLHPGQLLGLIGPNGAGKTTLMNVLTGLHAPTAGRVLMNGVDVTRWPTYRRARSGLGRTFQDVRLFLNLTVSANAIAGSLGARLSSRTANERARELLERFDLAAYENELAGSLNHVQQRKLAIARALGREPQFLLLDEPGAGLSEAESDGLMESLRAIRADKGCGLLVIEHDMRLIMRLCETIQVLNEGATVAFGPPSEIQKDPRVLSAYLGT